MFELHYALSILLRQAQDRKNCTLLGLKEHLAGKWINPEKKPGGKKQRKPPVPAEDPESGSEWGRGTAREREKRPLKFSFFPHLIFPYSNFFVFFLGSKHGIKVHFSSVITVLFCLNRGFYSLILENRVCQSQTIAANACGKVEWALYACLILHIHVCQCQQL